jgi:aminoglycoside phosphotransferase (APT) family kinase protein
MTRFQERLMQHKVPVRDVVETEAEARALPLSPLLVLRPLEAYLDSLGFGSGPLSARRIGEGNSNVTFLVEREGTRLVLRRPPRPPLPPSAHDMLRESRVQRALEKAGAPVPHVVAVCDEESVLGVPFYLMDWLEGAVVTDTVPGSLDPRGIGRAAVDALAEIHAVDWSAAGLEGFGKPDGYLARQIRRWSGLWEVNATRLLPAVAVLGEQLAATMPESPAATVVHGDYRLGNLMLAEDAPERVLAVLDWELSTIGDPLADLGYLLATWSDADSAGTPLELSPVTRNEGFPARAELADRYAACTGRSLEALSWYEALALWKGAVFCEAIYGRFLRGERDDAWSASLENGVPRLLDAAESRLSGLRR